MLAEQLQVKCQALRIGLLTQLRNTARVNRALATAGNLFSRGVENSFNRTKDPLSARDFQNKWSQVADIEAIQLYDAIKNGNKADVKFVVDSMGGPNSESIKKLCGILTL